MSKEVPKVFIDLVQSLNEFELETRKVIDQQLIKAQTLEEFTAAWCGIKLMFSDGVTVDTDIKKTQQEIPRYLCRLRINVAGAVALELQFWIRSAPTYQGEEYASPLRMYHTKVKVYPVPEFSPFKYYDTIMYLIRKVLPDETKLLLYVRQSDSRNQLDQGVNPQQIPLTKVFSRAGWKFVNYEKNETIGDPLRKHKLTLVS